MLDTAAALLPVFLLIVAGFLIRRTLMPDDAHWSGPERLTYYVLFPALLIDTLARADFTGVPVAGVAGALVGAILAMSVICLAARPLMASRLAIDGPAFTSLFQGATRWQTFVGLAVSASLYGAPGVALASVAVATMIPVLNVINVIVLARYAAAEPPGWRAIVTALVRNPFIWSCAAGIALNVLGLPLTGPIHVFADALGRASLAIGLLLTGAGLAIEGLLRPAAANIIATALKLVLMPAMALGLAMIFGLSGTALAVVGVCSSVPTASNAYVLARQMGGHAGLMSEILTLQTVLAVITMPIVLALVGR
ncbi:MAG: AEC family transporter [Pseudolabrys sp.]